MILTAALCAALLARFAPGFGVDEREIDPSLGSASVQRIRAARNAGGDLPHYLLTYAVRLSKGDFGYSVTLNEPVAALITERLPATAIELRNALLGSAAAAFAFAVLALALNWPAVDTVLLAFGTLLLCIPAGLLGYLALWWRLSSAWVLGAAVFPHLFRYTFHLLKNARESSHVPFARSRGLSALRTHAAHVLFPCVSEMLAAAGMSASIAFGASIPVECVTNTPGIGQLAWQAASSRDFPLLIAITILGSTFVLAVDLGTDLARGAFRLEEAQI